MEHEKLIIDLESDLIKESIEKMKSDFKQRNFKKEQIEQIGFRVYLCSKCIKNKKCSFCGCNPIDVLSEPNSCNKGKIFPDFFKENEDWEKFKTEHNIEVI